MKLGIIGAMDIEVDYLQGCLKGARAKTIAGMNFVEGELDGMPVVVVFCSVGKVNAALCAQALIYSFGVDAIINTGVAGSLNADINIGDLVVSTDAVYHDVDVANCGYELGQVPGMDTVAFPTDEALRRAVVRAAAAVAPEIQVFEGRIASGDQFVRDQSQMQFIISQFGALCCEMEGAAIAHTCYLAGIPCVIVRAISDKADGSDAELYDVFEAKAARHCASIVEAMVKAL